MRKLTALDPSMMGPEPSWADPANLPTLTSALSWYTYSFGNKEAKEFVLDYAKSVGRSKDEIENLKSISDDKYIKQFGWVARMMCVGYTPDDKTKEFFTKTYKSMFAYVKKTDAIKTEEVASDATLAPRVTIQSRIQDKAHEEAGDLEGLIDDFVASGCKMQIDLDNYVKNKKLSSVVLKKICDIFVVRSSRIANVIESKDPQIKEGYSNFTKPELRRLKDFLDAIVAATNKGAVESKPVRKTRKKKEKPAAVLASKVSYLKEDPETGLKSVLPEKIIGASQVWVYNAKTRILGVYRAADARGLSIKGTTIQNYKEDAAIAKKLRKPKETLDKLATAGKVKLNQILSELTTKECNLTGRCNSDTIIVKVVN
jgi:hypothetical protein